MKLFASSLASAPRLRRAGASTYSSLGSIALLVVTLAGLQLFADVVVLQLWPTVYQIDASTYRAGFFLTNVSDPEGANLNDQYRWTFGSSTFRAAPLGTQTRTLVTFELGGRPEAGQGRVLVQGQELAAFSASTGPQQLHLVLPPQSISPLDVTLEVDTFSAPGDPRALGLRLDSISLTRVPAGLPLPPITPYAAQLVLLAVTWGIAGRLRAPRLLRLGLIAVLTLLLAGGMAAALPMADVFFPWLAAAALVLAAATWGLLGYVERLALFADQPREARVLWALMLLACGVRALGALFPTFSGQDLGYHRDWMREVLGGDLVLATHSFEFAGGVIVYPPGTYIALLPGLLLTSNVQPILQGALALLDGTGTLFVALLAYRCGLGRTTARFAALLYAGSLPLFTAIAYGFSAQIMAQWCVVPIALAILAAADQGRVGLWARAMGLALLPMLLHTGVAILVVVWVAIALGLLMLQREQRSAWPPLLYLAAGLVAFVFVYSYGAASMLSQARAIVGESGVASDAGATAGMLKGATPLLAKGARLAYSDIGLALLPLGMALLPWRQFRWSQRSVLAAWLLTCLVLFVVDLVFALQVRYIYFSIPIAAIVVGHTLSSVASTGRWGRAIAWAVVLGIALQGAALWLGATFGDVFLSLTPLTH